MKRFLLRAGLALAGALAVLLPVGAMTFVEPAVAAPIPVRDQVPTPAAAPATDPAYARFATDPAVTARTRGAVLILTYHDISPTATGAYAVTPAAFAEQLAMLRTAGFTSVSADTLLASRTDPSVLPARPVMITFDDGTGGVWRYADPLLETYGFRGVAFVITGRIGTHYPYYLTWSELSAMHDSGRWDVESHTANGHDRRDVGGGDSWPFLINRLLLPTGVLETRDEARARLTADADTAVADLVGHDLGRPTMFAYPFSASLTPTDDPVIARESRDILAARYPLLLTNDGVPHWASAAALRSGPVSRIEVVSSTTTRALFDRIVAGVPAPAPGDADPAEPAAWTADAGFALDRGPGTATVTLHATGTDGTTARFWADAAGDWTDYTVSGTWTVDGGGYSALLLRDGSAHPVRLSIGRTGIAVTADDGPPTELRIADRASHDLRVTLAGARLSLRVDGVDLPPVPLVAAAGGGIGLRVTGAGTTTVRGLAVTPAG